MNISLGNLRENYTKGGLLRKDVQMSPFQQFQQWLKDAVEAKVLEPNAMTLATVNQDNKPVARIVLLKNLDDRGFVFFTNYNSQKGNHLDHSPWASLVFWWGELERQVRVEGKVEKITADESDVYFTSRPIGSQLGALVSPQSQVIPNREFLEKRLTQLTEQYQNQAVPRPENWGGYRVIPHHFEFWQGRQNRLHDRLSYRLHEDQQQWQIDRLAP